MTAASYVVCCAAMKSKIHGRNEFSLSLCGVEGRTGPAHKITCLLCKRRITAHDHNRISNGDRPDHGVQLRVARRGRLDVSDVNANTTANEYERLRAEREFLRVERKAVAFRRYERRHGRKPIRVSDIVTVTVGTLFDFEAALVVTVFLTCHDWAVKP